MTQAGNAGFCMAELHFRLPSRQLYGTTVPPVELGVDNIGYGLYNSNTFFVQSYFGGVYHE